MRLPYSLHHHTTNIKHQLIPKHNRLIMSFHLINPQLSFITLTIFLVCFASGQTKIGFYDGKCPGGESGVEKIVRDTMSSHFAADSTIAPKLLRMHFHDCFVNGCDGSVLLDGPNSEKTAVPNLSLKAAFPAIDDAKAKIEAVCPGVVSCADILALAARDSAVLTSRRFMVDWAIPTGRRDGNVSLASDTNNLPSPTDDVPTQIQKFNDKGLSVQDLVTLVGAHTIGFTDCQFFSYRLYNYNNTNSPDPTIDPKFLPTLQNLCPATGNGSVRVALDTNSPSTFDKMYFKQINISRGILESDQRLLAHNLTNPVLQRYVSFGLDFKVQFARSMLHMSNIGVLTGTQGNIRTFCNATN